MRTAPAARSTAIRTSLLILVCTAVAACGREQPPATEPSANAASAPPPPTVAAKPEMAGEQPWFEVIMAEPDPSVVTDADALQRIVATGLPWKVRHRSTGIAMLLCPAGEFVMGSPETEFGRLPNEVQHRRTIRKPFYLSETEVTQRQWQSVMGGNPSMYRGDDRPVDRVSWEDSRRFCETTGLRLPTEAEWEYACRAGTVGSHAGEVEQMAWIAVNSGTSRLDERQLATLSSDLYMGKMISNSNESHLVGQLRANPWGFYDMHGNLWEWVEDVYAAYPTEGGDEQAFLGDEASTRVLRGGAFPDLSFTSRSAIRLPSLPPGESAYLLGFRVARTPD